MAFACYVSLRIDTWTQNDMAILAVNCPVVNIYKENDVCFMIRTLNAYYIQTK